MNEMQARRLEATLVRDEITKLITELVRTFADVPAFPEADEMNDVTAIERRVRKAAEALK
jgi:hypothetical protein